MTEELRTATWFKSPYSGGNGGDCVEVAHLSEGGTAVRDSKNSTSMALVFTAAWRAFPAGARDGVFDR